jgi:micrococcal nuclease
LIPGIVAELERGNQAGQRLIQILNSGTITVIKRGSRDVDRYGRSLRVVQINGRSAGNLLVAEGLARPWSDQRRRWCT